MTIKCECTACGEDCTHGYATHNGYPYHFGCLPTPKVRRRAVITEPDRNDINDAFAVGDITRPDVIDYSR